MKNRLHLSFSAHVSLKFGAVLFACLASLAFTAAAPVSAEEQLPDRFMMRLGGYLVHNADTVVRLDANGLPVGTYIDFQQTLGGDTRATVFWMDGVYRFNENHALGFSWYDLKFTGNRVLGQDIVWGGYTFPLATPVSSELKFDVYKLNYRYSLYRNDKVELGLALGLHVMHTFASISAYTINQAQSDAVTAPLPVFGLFASYNFTPRFSAFYNYEAFFINYQDKARGGLEDFLIGLEYRVFRHVALGAAYSRFTTNLELKDNSKTLTVNSGWNGGMLYGGLYF
jgi:hypothetical protein